jgi:hypothetical protein
MAAQGNTQPPPSAIAMRLAAGFQASQAVIVAAQLGIADLLSKNAMTSREVAQKTGTQPDKMHRLLRALAAFAVVEDCGDGTFQLTPVGHSLRADAPNSVRPLVLMYGNFWPGFASLAECVKTGKNAYEILFGLEGSFAYYEKHPDKARVFDAAMSALSALTGPAAARSYDFAGVSRVIDIGGGHGKVLASILKEHPRLHGVLFDLPRVVEGAAPFLAGEGLAGRCEVVSGDMFASVPSGCDLYLLSHIIHDWDDERAIKVLQSCRRAMGQSARLLILDRVMPERVLPDPMVQGQILTDLVMMVATVGGRERTASEFQALLEAAGLRLQRIIAMPTADSLVEAMPA